MKDITLDSPLVDFTLENCTFVNVVFDVAPKNVEFRGCTFTNASFKRATSAVRFVDCTLQNVGWDESLYDVHMIRSTVVGCKWLAIRWKHGLLSKTRLENVIVDGAFVQDLAVQDCKVYSLSAVGARFVAPRIETTTFRECALDGSIWSRGTWDGVTLGRSSAKNATWGLDLTRVTVSHSILRNSTFENTLLRECVVRCTLLEEVRWHGCSFIKTQIRSSSARGATMEHCLLGDCCLHGCSFERGSFRDTIFRNLIEHQCNWGSALCVNVKRDLRKRALFRLVTAEPGTALEVKAHAPGEARAVPCEMRTEGNFYAPTDTDFFTAEFPASWLPYSTRTDVFEVIERIEMEDGTVFVPDIERTAFIRRREIVRRHSF